MNEMRSHRVAWKWQKRSKLSHHLVRLIVFSLDDSVRVTAAPQTEALGPRLTSRAGWSSLPQISSAINCVITARGRGLSSELKVEAANIFIWSSYSIIPPRGDKVLTHRGENTLHKASWQLLFNEYPGGVRSVWLIWDRPLPPSPVPPLAGLGSAYRASFVFTWTNGSFWQKCQPFTFTGCSRREEKTTPKKNNGGGDLLQ